MFEYFHDMLRFGAFYRKIGIKTSDFRDLKLTTNDFIRMSMIIKWFVLV